MAFPPKSGDSQQEDPVTARKKAQRASAEATVKGSAAPQAGSQPPGQANGQQSEPELAMEPSGPAEQGSGFRCPACGCEYDMVPKQAPVEPPTSQPAPPASPGAMY